MAGFTSAALEKKLSELNSSQQSIQTLSLWLIHHRKHHKTIVQVWFRELKKAKSTRKLTFMYLANDVIQNSKKKGPEFSREFSTVLSKAFQHVHNAVSDDKTKTGLDRIINVWEERNVYDSVIIEELRESVAERKPSSKKLGPSRENKMEKIKDGTSEKRKFIDTELPSKKKKNVIKEEPEVVIKSPPGEPPETDILIKALQDLENSPSTDAEVREKIANLPPKVSDISLLEKVQSREAADKLSKQVNEACTLLADYNSRLSEELENRKNVSKMLSDFLHRQRELIALSEKKVENLMQDGSEDTIAFTLVVLIRTQNCGGMRTSSKNIVKN